MPSSVQCRNVGNDGYNVEWECKADLEQSVRFGPLTVVCEGYDNSEDTYVLRFHEKLCVVEVDELIEFFRGSCQLEYSLQTTSAASKYKFGFVLLFVSVLIVFY